MMIMMFYFYQNNNNDNNNSNNNNSHSSCSNNSDDDDDNDDNNNNNNTNALPTTRFDQAPGPSPEPSPLYCLTTAPLLPNPQPPANAPLPDHYLVTISRHGLLLIDEHASGIGLTFLCPQAPLRGCLMK